MVTDESRPLAVIRAVMHSRRPYRVPMESCDDDLGGESPCFAHLLDLDGQLSGAGDLGHHGREPMSDVGLQDDVRVAPAFATAAELIDDLIDRTGQHDR